MAHLFAGSLVRIIVTVATLAAIYFFIIKPVLETTETTVNRGLDQSSDIQREIREATDAAGITGLSLPDSTTDSVKNQRKVERCIKRAINRSASDPAAVQAKAQACVLQALP